MRSLQSIVGSLIDISEKADSSANKKTKPPQKEQITTMTGEPPDRIVINPPIPDKVTSEAVNLQTRVKRAVIMRRYRRKIEQARKLARKRVAGGRQIRRRSLKQARDVLRRRLAGSRGVGYSKLNSQDKIAVDKLLDKKRALVKKIARRIYNHIKQNEYRRFAAASTGKAPQRVPVPVTA